MTNGTTKRRRAVNERCILCAFEGTARTRTSDIVHSRRYYRRLRLKRHRPRKTRINHTGSHKEVNMARPISESDQIPQSQWPLLRCHRIRTEEDRKFALCAVPGRLEETIKKRLLLSDFTAACVPITVLGASHAPRVLRKNALLLTNCIS